MCIYVRVEHHKKYVCIYIYSKRLRPIPPGLGSRILGFSYYNLGRRTTSLWMNSHAKIASFFGKQKEFAYTIHISFSISTHTVPFGAMLGSFGIQVGGFGGPSWRFGSLFGVYVGACRPQMGVWQAQRPQARGFQGLGLVQGRLGTWIWAQHGSNLSQVGANLGPS